MKETPEPKILCPLPCKHSTHSFQMNFSNRMWKKHMKREKKLSDLYFCLLHDCISCAIRTTCQKVLTICIPIAFAYQQRPHIFRFPHIHNYCLLVMCLQGIRPMGKDRKDKSSWFPVCQRISQCRMKCIPTFFFFFFVHVRRYACGIEKNPSSEKKRRL